MSDKIRSGISAGGISAGGMTAGGTITGGMTAEAILAECDALLHGHFLYTSGRHGEIYMQCAKVQQYPQHMEAIAKIIADGFKNEKVDMVIAPAIGGIVLGYELARQLNAKAIFAERQASDVVTPAASAGGSASSGAGKMTLRRGFEIPKGARVVAAEDVVTTGGSVMEVMDIVKECGGELVGVGIIVDRTGGEIDLGTKLVSAYSKKITSYAADECPLCKEGVPIMKPGSRAQV